MNMTPLPYFGDLLTLSEFKLGCDTGLFTDDDGIGYFATISEESDIEAVPSDIRGKKHLNIDPRLTHVIWYNK